MKFCSLTRKMDPNGPWTSLGLTRGFLLLSLSVWLLSPLLLFSPWPCCQTGSSVSSPIADMKFPPCPGLRFDVNCHWMYRTERCIFSCLCVPDTSMCVPDTSSRCPTNSFCCCVLAAGSVCVYCEGGKYCAASPQFVSESVPTQIYNIRSISS